MKIAIIATGSRGDVQPYIALGKGLQECGHTVRFVTHQNFDFLVQQHGLKLWPIKVNVQEIAQTQTMQKRIEDGNFLTLMSQMAKEAKQAALLAAEVGLAACRGVDLILGGMGGMYIGLSLAEKYDLPFMQAHLVPFSPTREFAGVLMSSMPAFLGNSFNRATHHLARQIIWQGFRSSDRLTRQKVLELPPAPFWGPYHSPQMRGMPTLYGFSPSVIQCPLDWGEEIRITGYWFLESEDDWLPPSALLEFLDAGPPPVYIGFGSMSHRKPEETADLVIEALQTIDQRAILLSGWGGLKKTDLPDSIMMIESIPHNWLFPRMAAVVHHGGAGTTAAGLHAGVPSLVVPFFGDQPFWGQRIAELGVGPQPIPRKQLTAEGLAASIQQAVSNPTMRQQAAELGEKIRAEEGVKRAVEVIGQL